MDQWTSGLLVVAKNNGTHDLLEEKFKTREIQKFYRTIISGRLKQPSVLANTQLVRDPKRRTRFKAIIDDSSSASGETRKAISRFTEIQRFTKPFSLAGVEIFTGRTHQIRAHAHYLNTPILGDDLYGFHFNGKTDSETQQVYKRLGVLFYLQAARLVFEHPWSQKKLDLNIHLPDYFKEIIKILE